MKLLEAIKNRRSIRIYRKQELSEGTVEKLIDAASMAPSAGDIQPWEFVIVSSQNTKRALCSAAYNQKNFEEVSIVIVACADEKRAEEAYGARGKNIYCIQDTAAAIQNILLTACSLGLGSCWIGAFKEEEIRKLIKAPKSMKPIALVSIGFPNEAPVPRFRRPVSEIMHKETF